MGLYFAIGGMVLVSAILYILSSDRKLDEQAPQDTDTSEMPGTLHAQHQEQLSSRGLQSGRPAAKIAMPSPLERRGLFKTVLICVLIILFAIPLKRAISNSAPAKAMRRAIFGLSEEQYREICLGHLKPALEEAARRRMEAELEGDMDDPLAFEEAMFSIVNRAGFFSLKALMKACNEANGRYNK